MTISHVCSLKTAQEAPYPEIKESDTCWRRLWVQFQRSTLISTKNPRCRLFFRSDAAINAERRRHIKSGLTHIIHPFSVFRIYWELYMIMVFFASLMYKPYNFAFSFQYQQNIAEILIAGCFLDISCLIDIAITFFTGYGIMATHEVVLDPGKISRNYVFGYFLMDLISSIPIEMIQLIIQKFIANEITMQVLEVFGLLKLFRFRSLLLYLGRAADLWQLNYVIFEIILYLVIIIIIVHWVACMQYIVPMLKHDFTGSLGALSWIYTMGVQTTASKWSKYTQCLFRAICYLTSVNQGLIQPQTLEDMVVGILTLLFGKILMAYYVIKAFSIFKSWISAETKYDEIMNQVGEYMKYKQLPLSMQKRLGVYYNYRFRKSYFREDAITNTLSEPLRREINVFSCQRLVENVTMFRDLPQNIVVDIVNSLTTEIFLPNDMIIKAGTLGDCMYFISTGTVSVTTTTGKEICHLQDGDYFGEIALVIKDQVRIANVVAIEICEVHRLDRNDFKKCFRASADLYRQIEQVAMERRDETTLVDELHKQYLLGLEKTESWT